MTPRRSILVCAAFGLLIVSLEPSAAKECRDGFYKSPRGVCCKLCPAGTYKVVECIIEFRRAVCDLCPVGTFMDRHNQEEACKPCSSCGPDEKMAYTCSVAQDTICQCTEGFKRNRETGVCLLEEPHSFSENSSDNRFNIVLACFLPLIIILVFILMHSYRKLIWVALRSMVKLSRRCIITTSNEDEERVTMISEGNPENSTHITPARLCIHSVGPVYDTLKLISGKREELVEWIGEDPSPFLNNFKNSHTTPYKVQQLAKAMNGVELILEHFISQGEAGCVVLWEALYCVRMQYTQLQKWMLQNGKAVLSIRRMKNYLNCWIGENPLPLRDHLKIKSLVSDFILKNPLIRTNGAEWTEMLLNNFIQRGDYDCLELLHCLQEKQDNYPRVKTWLQSLEFLKHQLREGDEGAEDIPDTPTHYDYD